jgi:ribosome maturation factor RimP
MNDDAAPAADERFLREAGTAGQIAELVAPALGDMGFRLVRVRMMGRGEQQTLQIMAERPDGTISIDECEAISRQLSPLLDAADLIPGAHNLEISSPGIDRPLVRPSDFEDWVGYQAKIELTELLDGRRRFSGILDGFTDGEVRIEVDLDQIGVHVIGLPVALISEARLVLTDELARESLRRSKAAGRTAGDGESGAADASEGSDGDGDPADQTDDGNAGEQARKA